MTLDLRFHEIVSLDDELYDPWLDLYQAAFPLNEQMLVSAHNGVLRDKKSGQSGDEQLLAALDAQGKLLAMARYDVVGNCDAAALWYLAVISDARNKGIGSLFYQEILRRVRGEKLSVRALVFEVEDPDTTHSADERDLARRRIAFYQRNGARLLCGIHYIQSVGWQDPVPMRVMVHPCTPGMDAAQAIRVAKCVFGDALQEVGPPALE